ncbi:ScbR family autoregulator-binding transcription factor [Cellulomonas sp.]|uniref:ScbR family autoregulator-binding transcription factor n=1 Tax=Cellulomonas sp. TaxID=40001 RepID=UPI001B1DE7A9|nr:ScbR family autoregulator-binding transcription factor [Cellulomonas sp.]MBO9556716.1 TetR/AcrR family transcriptional regulator [Cellulomonas sp.]
MPPTSRQRQKLATRAAILRVAAEEFDAKGYVGTAISDIATRLELTKGSVYFHFPSKAQLAAVTVDAYFRMWDPVLEEVQTRGLTGLEAMRQVSHRVAAVYRDDVAVRAAVRLMRESALIDADLPTPFVGWMRVVRTYLDQAVGAGTLRGGLDLDAVAWHVVATFFGVQEVSHQLDDRAGLERRIDMLWDLLLPGIAAPR